MWYNWTWVYSGMNPFRTCQTRYLFPTISFWVKLGVLQQWLVMDFVSIRQRDLVYSQITHIHRVCQNFSSEWCRSRNSGERPEGVFSCSSFIDMLSFGFSLWSFVLILFSYYLSIYKVLGLSCHRKCFFFKFWHELTLVTIRVNIWSGDDVYKVVVMCFHCLILWFRHSSELNGRI